MFIPGRGKYKDSLLPGKVYKSGSQGAGLYVAENGKEHCVKDYEMLVATTPMKWIGEHDGKWTERAYDTSLFKYRIILQQRLPKISTIPPLIILLTRITSFLPLASLMWCPVVLLKSAL